MKTGLFNREVLIRAGFVIFLFVIGYLVGAGIGKTIQHVSKSGKQAAVVLTGDPEYKND